jgi:hypothetical protein
MLRSLAIGFAVAALLQFGVSSAALTSGVPLTKAFSATSLECESAALSQFLSKGLRLLLR